jgi:hypothetical protein
MRLDQFLSDEAPKKNPSVATFGLKPKRLQISESTGSRKHAVTSPP